MHPIRLVLLLALLSGCQAPAFSDPPPASVILSGPPEVELVELSVDAPPEEPPTPLSGPPILRREAIPHHDARFHDHYQEAVAHREDGDPGAAVDALRLALFDSPDSAVSWLLLGELYLDFGRRAQGIDCVERASQDDPDLVGAREILARDLLDRGEPKAARVHADRLVALQPGSSVAHLLQARSYLGLAMWSEAIGAARRSIARDPQQVEPYNALGFAALQLGENGLALQYLEAATELPGIQAHTLNNLGIAYERAGRDLDALETYARAARLRPGYATALANRDRMREAVDRSVADDVSRILADRLSQPGQGQAELVRPASDTPTP